VCVDVSWSGPTTFDPLVPLHYCFSRDGSSLPFRLFRFSQNPMPLEGGRHAPIDGLGALFVQNFTASKSCSSDGDEMLYLSSTIGAAFVIYHTKTGLSTMASTRHFTGTSQYYHIIPLPGHPTIPVQLLTRKKCVSIVC